MVYTASTFSFSHSATTALARNYWAILIRGIAAVIFGIVALILPGVAVLSLLMLFAAYLVVDGVFAIASAVRAMQAHERWAVFILEGILDFVLAAGVILIPAGAILTFVWMTAIWAVVTGALMIAAAFRMRHSRWWIVIGGAVSVLWGIALAVLPFIGALVLTWWLAAYAIVFGISLIIAAFRLRHATYSLAGH